MLGLLVELLVSWIIIRFAEKKNLEVLGLRPTASRLKSFAVFFLLAAACVLVEVLLRYLFFNERYLVNPNLSPALVGNGLWWNLKSVFYEELIFRGVLLYILIRRLGVKRGILISAGAFGIYHWFSYELWGSPVPMIYVFIVTGIMGVVLAYAYAKTFSMYVAIAFHLGWNFVHGFVFSKGPIGNGIFMLARKQQLNVSYFTYYTVTLLPLFLAFLSTWLVIKKWDAIHKKQGEGITGVPTS